MSQHAACSPSSAAMWMACPASVTKTKGMTRPSSRFAKEGTAAHAVAEMIINGDIFLPDKITIEGDEVIVSPGMARALNPYVSYVQSLEKMPGAWVTLEQRLVVPGTYNMVWGTLDCGALVDSVFPPRLFVADLKFGKGVAVDPSSPQLKFYALALAHYYKMTHRRAPVTLTICQPRIGGEPLRHYKTTLGALMDWRNDVVLPAVAAIKAGDETEIAGAHCRWCVRKTECAAFNGKHQSHAAGVFDDEAVGT